MFFGASPGSEPGLFFSNNLLGLGSPCQLEYEVGILSTMLDFPFFSAATAVTTSS